MTKPKRPNSVRVVPEPRQGEKWFRVETRRGHVHLGYVHPSYRWQEGTWRGVLPMRLIDQGFDSRAEAVAAVVEHAKREVAEATP